MYLLSFANQRKKFWNIETFFDLIGLYDIDGERKEGAAIKISPFQKALLRAWMERNQKYLTEGADVEKGENPELCLWVDWKTKRISMTAKTGFYRVVYSSPSHRAAAIDRLKRKRFKILP